MIRNPINALKPTALLFVRELERFASGTGQIISDESSTEFTMPSLGDHLVTYSDSGVDVPNP